MKISLLKNRTDTHPEKREASINGLRALLLGTSRALPITSASYGLLEKKAQGMLKDGPAWIPGEVREGARTDASTVSISCLVFDFDSLQRQDLERMWRPFDGLLWLAHTSASSTKEKPKWRMVLPLTEPVPAVNWRDFWLDAVFYFQLEGRIAPDAAAKNPSRLYYLPSRLSDLEAHWLENKGRLLDAGEIPGRPRPPALPAPKLFWGSDSAVKYARNYLRKMGPAIEGAGGDRTTFRAACFLMRDLGLSRSKALEMLAEWNASNQPPWSAEDLEAKAENALRYGKNPIGCRRPAEERER